MTDNAVEKQIRAPREEVFRVASDFAGSADVVGDIVRVEMLTDGPTRVGTRWRETRRMGKREATADLEVTAFDPPRSYSVGCHMAGCRFHSEFTFEELDGGTRVRMTFETHPEAFLAKVFGFALRPMFAGCLKTVAKDFDDLAEVVEKESAGAR